MEQQQTGVAMSGGVDSSVAAWLLREKGYPLLGVTMRLFPVCGTSRSEEDAARVAAQLGFAHRVLEMEEAFCRQVIDPFTAAYERGETPNPCVLCNRTLKFGQLLDRVGDLGCAYLATGHYAAVAYEKESGRYLLKKARDPEKDQSYFLCLLRQEQLARVRFPLGEMRKEEIRNLAREAGLVTARRKDSQDICFIPDGDYAAFIRRYTGREYPAGPFLNEAGQMIGVHRGMIGYTVGQRRGLGVSSNQGRLYVKQVRAGENAVVLSGDSALYSRVLLARDINWIACKELSAPLKAGVRIRSRHKEQPAVVEQTGEDAVRVTFDTPQRAIAPGQTVVFYDGDIVIGGGVITAAE